MISAPTLFDVSQYQARSEDWCSDDWETPDDVARPMAGLLLPTDRRVLEPSAGTGQIVKWIETGFGDRILIANELNPRRFEAGKSKSKGRALVYWNNGDFLRFTTELPPMGDCSPVERMANVFNPFDCIIGNPPFSLALDFIEVGLRLLNPANPEARILFLLPSAFFQSKGRGDRLQSLPCRIHQVHAIKGRVAYLQNGRAQSGRQCDDSVFDIRPGSGPAGWQFLDR